MIHFTLKTEQHSEKDFIRWLFEYLVHFIDKFSLILFSPFQLETLANVEDLIKRYSVLSEYLKFNMSRVERSQNSSHARKYTQHVSEMWRVISPILCGPSHKDESKDNSERAGLNFISDNRQSSVRALRFMLYMLTHDPKILYSPNGTDADKVINKVG